MNSPLRLGIAGLGSVGTSVFRLLQGCKGAQSHGCAPVIASVCARDRSRDRGVDLSGIGWSEDPVSLAASDEIDCFVELIGGDDGPALEAVEAALSAGKHVVTANKALLAAHGLRLAELAEKNGASLCFEAAVAGGIPIIKTLREALRGNTISRVYGILNGTCNYILTRMEQEGLTFQDCLSDAQRLGYAEADPTFDVEGLDTAHKLAILTSLAFGTRIDFDGVVTEGIERITLDDIQTARDMGFSSLCAASMPPTSKAGSPTTPTRSPSRARPAASRESSPTPARRFAAAGESSPETCYRLPTTSRPGRTNSRRTCA